MLIETKKCPMCRERHYLDVNEAVAKQIDMWMQGKIYIQEIDLDADDRELLMTGICKECWEKL